MKLRSRVTGLALVLTVGLFGAAACGSDDDSSTKDDDTKTSQEDDSAKESDEPADESGDKPSKDEVIAGYSELMTDMMGQLPEGIVNDVVTCFVDEVYDDASVQTLQAIADANAAGIDQSDTQLFADATTTCQNQLTP